MKQWIKDLFGTEKPVIGVLHMHAMPTDPKYDHKAGIQGVLEAARKDLHAYQDGGIDGVLFCNEFSIPYIPDVHTVTVASMARVIGELRSEIKVPMGVTVAADAMKGFDLAAAVEADFIREVLPGASAGVYGISDIHPGELERHRAELDLMNCKTMTAVVPEGTRFLAPRPLEEVAKTLAFNLNPDVMLVYSTTPGTAIDVEQVETIKSVTDTPVFASNGVKAETVKDIFKVADGAVVATSTKVDGKFFNPVDVDRVRNLMANARSAREV